MLLGVSCNGTLFACLFVITLSYSCVLYKLSSYCLYAVFHNSYFVSQAFVSHVPLYLSKSIQCIIDHQKNYSLYTDVGLCVRVAQVSQVKAEEMRQVCHKQKVVIFHKSDSSYPISCSNSRVERPLVWEGNKSRSLGFHLWLIHMNQKAKYPSHDSHKTQIQSLTYANIVYSCILYTGTQTDTNYGCKHSWVCSERWQCLECRAEWLATMWVRKYYCPLRLTGDFSHSNRPALIITTAQTNIWAIEVPWHALFENATFSTNLTAASSSCSVMYNVKRMGLPRCLYLDFHMLTQHLCIMHGWFSDAFLLSPDFCGLKIFFFFHAVLLISGDLTLSTVGLNK